MADQLDRETEPAMALHLVAVILFQQSTSSIVHAPGRCVPQIIAFLQDHVAPEVYEKLAQYQSLVVKQLSGKSAESEAADEDQEEVNVGARLSEKMNEIKMLAVKVKKPVSD